MTQIIYQNHPGSSHSSLDIAREREEALNKNDLFWQKRINQIEVANTRSAAILEKEYNQSVSPNPVTSTWSPSKIIHQGIHQRRLFIFSQVPQKAY